MHKPVLLKEVIEILLPQAGEFIIDGTVDGGGHASAILEKIGSKGKLLGIDLDSVMINRLRSTVNGQLSNVALVHGNYADLPEILKKNKLGKADGLLLDLGFSSEQLDPPAGGPGRGFSFTKDEPLFMTYSASMKPVAQIIRELGENDLAKIIFDLSGERFSRCIAKAIKEFGRKGIIKTTKELRDIVLSAVPKNYERGRIDPATRTFQALRIYANRELENLETILSNLPKVIKSGGRAVIISFHSLEDRIVKNKFREMEKEGVLTLLTKKPLSPSDEEVGENPRARSAKLRAAIIN
jgi:16S rRNA (cytosine1402-N4)-methyltransferase